MAAMVRIVFSTTAQQAPGDHGACQDLCCLGNKQIRQYLEVMRQEGEEGKRLDHAPELTTKGSYGLGAFCRACGMQAL